MKNTLLSFFMLLLVFQAPAQAFLYEGFDYAVGDTLPSPAWAGINAGDQIFVTTGSLNYTGLALPVGNKVSFDGAGRDYHNIFTPVSSGTVYYSFIFQVTGLGSLDTNGGYFTGLGASTTLFGATLWTKSNGSGYQIGLNARTTLAYTSWSSTVYNINTPVFIVISYEMIAGTTNDIVKMWINPNPSTFDISTPPTQDITIVNGGTDLSSLDRIFIRQDSNSETPFADMDELRVGLAWPDVATTGQSGVQQKQLSGGFSIFPNPVSEFLNIHAGENISDLHFYNTLGQIVYSNNDINRKTMIVNTGFLPGGLYIAVIKDNSGNTFQAKFLKETKE